MNKAIIMICLTTLLLVTGCQSIDIFNSKERREFIEELNELSTDEKQEQLSDTEAKKIVWNNLTKIERVLDKHFDEAILYAEDPIVTEDILDENYNPPEIANLLALYKGDFRTLFSRDILGEFTRMFIYFQYTSMHGDYLSTRNMHMRFQITEQEKDMFVATFIELADEAYTPFPVRYTVYYVKENDQWLLDDYSAELIDDEPLELTVNEIRNYYKDTLESEALFIETIGDYHIFNITPLRHNRNGDSFIAAINMNDSTFNYNLQNEYELYYND